MEVECMCSSTHKQRGVLMMTVWRCKKNYNNSPNSFEMKNGKCENSNYRFVQMLELQIIFLSSIAIHDISVLCVLSSVNLRSTCLV